MAGLRFPALVGKMCFSGPSGQSSLWEGFVVSNQYRCTILICDAQCRQYNQSITTRWCMMHLTTGGFPIRSEESDEAHHICSVPLELFRYWRNLLQQQGIVAVHSYTHYNATHKRSEKRRSSLKWVVQVQPGLTVIWRAHECRSIWHTNTSHNVAQWSTHGLLPRKGTKCVFMHL